MGSCLSSDGAVAPSSPMPSSPGKRGRKGPRKRQGLSKSREQQLHRIPGRMFLNGASGVASLFSQQGKKGTNQDAMIVWENFGSRADTVFCGVFDGHGPLGHMVARKVRDSLPLKLSSHFEVTFGNDAQRQNSISTAGSMNSDDTGSIFLDEESSVGIGSEERLTEIFPALKELFLKAFKFMDKELKLHPSIDSFCSGTTAVTLIKQGQDLVIGNIGDSRAILGTRDQKGSLIAIQLTVDLKPNLPREAERIRRCKGRVFALRDEPDVARVWLPHCNSPGLAMARAFGDFCLKDYGLISVPEISHRRLTERDEFIVLATDGIWDVLSNKDVVDIIASAPVRSYAARTLVEIAVKSWRIKYPTSKIDDCAAVCLFLNPDSSESSSVLGNRELNGSFNATESANNKQESSIPVNLDRSGTVRPSSENHPEEVKRSPKPLMTRPPLPGKPSDGNADLREGYEWSALDGVSRMDTILTLPRFVAEEKQSTSSKTPK